MPYRSGDKTLAVIDIGSNSVRMVIYDLSHLPPEKVFNEKVICALGRDLGTTGKLHPDATISAYKALHAYKLLSEVYHVGGVEVVGTASLRDAHDGQDFIKKIEDEIGLKIRIISGDEEATYAAQGVLMFDPAADGVVADFGGGSLELARIHGNNIHDTVSLPMGAYRVQAMEDRAGQIIAEYLSPLKDRFGNLEHLYAIGGSWRILASAYMKEKGQKAELQGYSIQTPDMVAFCHKIMGMNENSLRTKYRMEAHHARLAGIAAFTLMKTLDLLEPKAFVVSTAGVRDGVAHEFLLSQAKTR